MRSERESAPAIQLTMCMPATGRRICTALRLRWWAQSARLAVNGR